MDSELTTGRADTSRTKPSRASRAYITAAESGRSTLAFNRSFVQFDGEGDTANAKPRAIGGHPAAVLRVACRRESSGEPIRERGGLRSGRHSG